MAELPLKFGGGETLLRRSQQVHCDEPIPQRELAPMHHRVGLQTLPIMAVLALEALLVCLPVMFFTSTFLKNRQAII